MKPIFASILLLAGILMACRDKRESEPLPVKDELNLKTGKVYPAMMDNLAIRIKEISDSRCPIGLVCFWGGEVTVTFEVKHTTAFDLTLTLHRHPVDTVDQYIFRLIDVLPYPVYQDEVPDSEKTVVLEVQHL